MRATTSTEPVMWHRRQETGGHIGRHSRDTGPGSPVENSPAGAVSGRGRQGNLSWVAVPSVELCSEPETAHSTQGILSVARLLVLLH